MSSPADNRPRHAGPDPFRPLHPPLPHPRSDRTILDYARERDPQAEQRERERLEAAWQHMNEPPPPLRGTWRHLERIVPAAAGVILLMLLAAIIVAAGIMLWRAA